MSQSRVASVGVKVISFVKDRLYYRSRPVFTLFQYDSVKEAIVPSVFIQEDWLLSDGENEGGAHMLWFVWFQWSEEFGRIFDFLLKHSDFWDR